MARPKLEQQRREQIIDALERFVLREGLARMTLARVADEAGLRRPLVRYFAGNRDDLILMLFDRMVERSEAILAEATANANGDLSASGFLDLLLDSILPDPVLDQLAGELWQLADRDETVRERLHGLYLRLCNEMAARLQAEGIGADHEDRFARAYAVLSLGFGHVTFDLIALAPGRTESIRSAARALLGLT